MIKLVTLLALTLAGCAADARPGSTCTCDPYEVQLSNANDAGVLEGNFLHILTYGCSPEGVVTPKIVCDDDVYTVDCHNKILHFASTATDACTVELQP